VGFERIMDAVDLISGTLRSHLLAAKAPLVIENPHPHAVSAREPDKLPGR
jgi:hypothetical protein